MTNDKLQMMDDELKFKGVILDFDGVIVDSISHNWLTTKKFMDDFGVQMSRSDYERYVFGRSSLSGVKQFLKDTLGSVPDQFGEQFYKHKSISDAKLAESALIYPDTRRFLDRCGELPMGVCTATRRNKLVGFLKAHDLLDRFEFFFTVEDVEQSKPAPDIYLLGSGWYKDNLGLSVDEIVVVEDSINGVLAAKAADLFCVAVTHTTDSSLLREAGADEVVDSMDEIKL